MSEKEACAAQCTKDQASFEATDADLNGAIAGLTGAMDKLSAAASTAAAPGLFLQLTPNVGVERALAMAQAMGFMGETQRTEMSAFLQSPRSNEDGQEKNKADYEFQSSGIVATLEKLLEQFTEESTGATAEWEKTEKSCEDIAATKTQEIEDNKGALDSAEGDASTLKGRNLRQQAVFAGLREDHQGGHHLLYLEEVKENCEVRAADFKQRSELRANEIQAMDTAKSVLKDKLQSLDETG
ncbi:unnamed protein product [Polarella glacialis]|uniref:Uncharacterized protein n=1 Tax=Polarella glacialis TaxID=89957 RepID=A0A813ICU3_POLGL|nr:unnamed protein product [Polarella glacialis]